MEARTGATTCPVPLSAAMGRVTNDVTPFASRWSRAGSELLLPAPAGRNATAYLLLRLEEKQPAAGYELTTDRGYRQALELGPGRWEWRAVSIPPGFSATNTVSLRFLAAPPWNPGLRGFPDNLAVLVGCAVVEPGDRHTRGERER
jgi:hypothetical protein